MIARVLVTGASRGIGRAVAERLLAEGRRVVAVGRDAERLRSIEGAEVLARDLRDARGLVAAARELVGGLDGLVHAAGVARHAPLGLITDEALDEALDLHVRAPLELSRDLSAQIGDGPGSIVFLTSTLAERPTRGTLVYSATKAALVAMTKALALELAPGVRVNAVSPGVVDTDMVRAPRLVPGELAPVGAARQARVAEQLEGLRRLHPLARLGTPEEVAETVVHALDAPWMTGSVLTLDGGLSAG